MQTVEECSSDEQKTNTPNNKLSAKLKFCFPFFSFPSIMDFSDSKAICLPLSALCVSRPSCFATFDYPFNSSKDMDGKKMRTQEIYLILL